jgi:hypothetical protein
MKKISSLIVCLALLAAGTAFALDLPDALKIPGLTVTGDVRTGLRVVGGTVDDYGKLYDDNPQGAPETGALAPYVYAYSDDLDDGKPFRAQLQLVWERENLGVKTRFRYNPIKDGELGSKLVDLNNTVNKAFVYGWLLDKKVKVSVGKGTDEAWGLFYSSYATTTGFDGKDGVKVDVLPIDGLSLGAHYGTDDLFAKAVNDGTFNDQKENYRRFVAGAKYTSDSFGIVASTVHNFVESDAYGTYSKDIPAEYVDKPLPNTSNVLFGLWVAPIEPLRIDLSVAAVNLGSKTKKALEADGEDMPGKFKKGDYSEYWFVLPKLKAEYAVNEQLGIALEIGDIAIADEYYYKDADATDAEDKGLGSLFPITITPSATYAINDDVTAGLGLNFKINVDGTDQFGIGFKPSAEFSLGSGAKFVVYDELTFYTKASDSEDFRKKHPNFYGFSGGASGTENTLQFDFVWTF